MLSNFENNLPQEGSDSTWMSTCPLCGAQYASSDAKVVSEKDGAYLLHTNCPDCGSSVISTLATTQLGLTSIGLITDLTFEDVMKFKGEETISDNELLEAYNFIETWNGRLEGILC